LVQRKNVRIIACFIVDVTVLCIVLIVKDCICQFFGGLVTLVFTVVNLIVRIGSVAERDFGGATVIVLAKPAVTEEVFVFVQHSLNGLLEIVTFGVDLDADIVSPKGDRIDNGAAATRPMMVVYVLCNDRLGLNCCYNSVLNIHCLM
jgi:hypothetical protein